MKKKIGIVLLSLFLLVSCRGDTVPVDTEDLQAKLDEQTVEYRKLEQDYQVLKEKLKEQENKNEALEEKLSVLEKALEQSLVSGGSENPSGTEEPENIHSEPTQQPSIGKVYVNPAPLTIENDISFSIAKAYFEPDRFVCHTYIHNGTDSTIVDIREVTLSVHNLEGVLAEATFDPLEGLTLSPGETKEWTFFFYGNTVKQKNGSLDALSLTSESVYQNAE